MGWRQRSARELGTALIKNAPSAEYPEALQGYLSALYTLNASSLPRAFTRSPETEMVQSAVHMAIRSLVIRLRRARGGGGPSIYARGTRRAHRAGLVHEQEQRARGFGSRKRGR